MGLIDYDLRDGAARVTLAAPDAGNVINLEAIDELHAAVRRLAATPDAQEGVAAFLEKRPPEFAS